MFLWLADEVIRRNPHGSKPVIFLSDGERALHDRQGEYLPENTVCILDLFHVMERLWKVAWCFFEERTQKHEAHQWVEERLKRSLEGKVDAVIRGMRYQATQRGLKGPKRKTVEDAAEYLAGNRDRMKYDDYLAAGYPIGSGVVEGACRHLVKDRMERTGMRWLPSGAQAMLDLRATYLNGEWDAFWNFHITQEDERLYVHSEASTPSKWRYVRSTPDAARSLVATRARVTFCGHVHRPALYSMSATAKMTSFVPTADVPVQLLAGRQWLAVLGAVGQPRDGNPAASFAMFDTSTQQITYCRVPYDVETAAMRIRENGLPHWLADRLSIGR